MLDDGMRSKMYKLSLAKALLSFTKTFLVGGIFPKPKYVWVTTRMFDLIYIRSIYSNSVLVECNPS